MALSKKKSISPTSYLIPVKRQATLRLHAVAECRSVSLLLFLARGEVIRLTHHITNPANRCCTWRGGDICTWSMHMWHRRSCHHPAFSFPLRSYMLLSVRCRGVPIFIINYNISCPALRCNYASHTYQRQVASQRRYITAGAKSWSLGFCAA